MYQLRTNYLQLKSEPYRISEIVVLFVEHLCKLMCNIIMYLIEVVCIIERNDGVRTEDP